MEGTPDGARRTVLAVAVLALAAGAVGGILVGQHLRSDGPPTPSTLPAPPTTTLPPAMCEAIVRIWLDANGKPTVTPKDVCMAKDKQLTWDIDPKMAAGVVDIDFDLKGSDKGPFKDKTGQNPHNQGRGKYVRKKADKSSIRSNDAEMIGRWTYTVTYIVGTKKTVADPAVCIRN